MNQMTPLAYQEAHQKDKHIQTKYYDGGTTYVEPITQDCLSAVHPILVTYELAGDKQVVHLRRHTQTPNLYVLFTDNPEVALPSDLQGSFTSVPAVSAMIKARATRQKRGYLTTSFGSSRRCDKCKRFHGIGECELDVPEEVHVKGLRQLHAEAIASGVIRQDIEVMRTNGWTMLVTNSKDLQTATEGEAAVAWLHEDDDVQATIHRPDMQFIHYVSTWTGVSQPEALEMGFTRLHDGIADVGQKMNRLFHQSTGGNKQ